MTGLTSASLTLHLHCYQLGSHEDRHQNCGGPPLTVGAGLIEVRTT